MYAYYFSRLTRHTNARNREQYISEEYNRGKRVVQSGGAAFISNNLLDAKPNQKRQFAQVVARKIIEDITNVELEQDCLCEQNSGWLGQARCKVVGRREKEAVSFAAGF